LKRKTDKDKGLWELFSSGVHAKFMAQKEKEKSLKGKTRKQVSQ